jgi:uncharacterized protein YprB with RNaseH-like and TPR domain
MMIAKTFLFLDGIGQVMEKMLWQQGIADWHQFIERKSIIGISKERKHYYDKVIKDARKELYALNSSHFIPLLPQSETWRLYEFFREDAIFLDIETTGMNVQDDINVVGLYDGNEMKTMIRGINLNYNALQEELANYKLLVTFNGATFDVPFMQKRYPKLLPPVPHIDLRTIVRRLGHSGGLKTIEENFGVKRNELVKRLHGGDAKLLWRMYYGSGDEHYLKLLVEYNEEDCMSLKRIADVCTKKMEHHLLSSIE